MRLTAKELASIAVWIPVQPYASSSVTTHPSRTPRPAPPAEYTDRPSQVIQEIHKCVHLKCMHSKADGSGGTCNNKIITFILCSVQNEQRSWFL